MTDPDKPKMNRREFLSRAAKAGVSVGIAGGLGYYLNDWAGPSLTDSADKLVSLPSYAIADIEPAMSIVTGADRVKTVGRALKAVGGIERFVNSGDRVLLKVNAAFATPATLGATTNPELVAEVARLCLSAGAASVAVTDNPINDPESCFAISGIAKAATSAGAKVIYPRSQLFRKTTLADGNLIVNWPLLYGPLENVNKVIGISPVKDHHRSGASMSMKNWYGLLGGRRNIFHQDINNIIKELAMMVAPTLVILDGTVTMMSNGPTGGSFSDLKQTNTMIVSTDQVAADAFGATLLDKTEADLPFISKAAEAGAGTTDFESLKLTRADVS